MAGEQFGTQGGFGDMMGAADAFKEGTGIFKTSVGKWTFGILSLKKMTEKLDIENLKNSFSSFLGDLPNLLSTSKLTDVISDLSNSLYTTRKELERTYGLFGGARNEVVSSLVAQSQATNDFGIRLRENIEGYKSLASEFRSRNFDTNLASATSSSTDVQIP